MEHVIDFIFHPLEFLLPVFFFFHGFFFNFLYQTGFNLCQLFFELAKIPNHNDEIRGDYQQIGEYYS